MLAGQREAGLRQLDKAVLLMKNKPVDPSQVFGLSVAYARAQQNAEASRLLDIGRKLRTTQTATTSPDALRCEGELALSRQEFETAVEKHRLARSLTNSRPYFTLPLANALMHASQAPEAITLYEEILTKPPAAGDSHVDWVLAHKNLAQLYEQSGDREKARAMYQRFLEIWAGADAGLPAVVEAQAALKRLGS